MTIANANDLIRLQAHVASAIVDHDKIVPGAVHLSESQHDIDLSLARRWPAPARLCHLEPTDDSRSARRRRDLGSLERQRPRNWPLVSRTRTRKKLYGFRASAAGRFHENFLEPKCRSERTRS